MADLDYGNWHTMTRQYVRDRLVALGVPDDRAFRMEHKAAIRELRRLERRVELFTNCPADVLVEDMIQNGVSLVEDAGRWRLSAPTLAAQKWRDTILVALRHRKAEIVAAWQARTTKPDYRVCPRCLSQIFDAEYEGVGCESIFSCPFRRQES